MLLLILLISLAQTRLVHTEFTPKTGEEAILIYQKIDQPGFVLTTADERKSIIGYSETGRFDADHMPPAMEEYLQYVAERIEAGARVGSSMSYEPVGPVMTTRWGQDRPYNLYTPTVSGKQTPTGCVATACAQIMKKNACPASYDWSIMRDTYYSSDQDAGAKEVARLMYDFGQSINMHYDPKGSGAQSYDALKAMYDSYGYDKSIFYFAPEMMCLDSTLSTIHRNLKAGRPVYVAGFTILYEGHAYVCDGMDEKGYLHINWGWDGAYDGYFALLNMTPYGQGTGGSASGEGFTVGIEIGCDIFPDNGGERHPTVTLGVIELKNNRCLRSESMGWRLRKLGNKGLENISGKIGLIVYQNGQRLKTIDVDNLYDGTMYVNQTLNIKNLYHTFSAEELGNGDYEFSFGVRLTGSETYHPILVMGQGEVLYDLKLTADSAIVTAQPYTIPTEIDHITDVYNNGHTFSLISTGWENSYMSPIDTMITGTLMSGGKQSVIGTYAIQGAKSSDPDTWNKVRLMLGNSNSYTSYTATGGVMTIDRKDSKSDYEVYLTLETELGRLERKMVINGAYLKATVNGSSSWDVSVNRLNNYDPAALSWDDAVLAVEDTLTPVYIRGIASEVDYSNRYLRMGDVECFDLPGLTSRMYANDTMIVVGLMQPHSKQIVDARLAKSKHPDYTITDLDIKVVGQHVTMTWTGLGPNYRVTIRNQEGQTLMRMDDPATSREFDIEDGEYVALVKAVTPATSTLGPEAKQEFTVGGTPLQNVEAKTSADKFVRNGQLVIRRGEKEYNAVGIQF